MGKKQDEERLIVGIALFTILSGYEKEIFKLTAFVVALLATLKERFPGFYEAFEKNKALAIENEGAENGKRVVESSKQLLEELETELVRLRTGGRLQ